MLPSRAGLAKPFSLRVFSAYSSPLTMRLGAVLLFLASLSAFMVHAAPIPAQSMTSVVGCIAPSGAYDAAESTFTLKSPYTNGHGYTQHHAPVQYTHPPPNFAVTERENAETVVIVRRKSLGAKIRAAFHHLGHKIKHAFQKVGHFIKHAAKKVVHFIKHTGAKIVKVATKIAATVGKVAGKVASFIPGGQAIAPSLNKASSTLNSVSDGIHTHIGGKLGKAMKGMNIAQKVTGIIPGGK
ncbi:hypothetical protein D9619_011111 [Psilocybe cf. subviscida]|uniref:Uncharacterized protein n=1 Tax=Psilocybe cf. subviscida TaxID=2480587 RepID=A0A8H5F595_9AGAR|nr:hypothetical protein D9619_011111 [Psilocybe cf. subviscida]